MHSKLTYSCSQVVNASDQGLSGSTPLKGTPTFLRDAFLELFLLRENVNLMYFVRVVVIKIWSPYVMEYFCT